MGTWQMSILCGMRVVESSAFVAVPLAGMTLAQMGAEVIRCDHIDGGLDFGRWPLSPNNRSLFWAGLNKGKKSVAINLKSSEGRELISEIIAAGGTESGFFITNLTVPGWTDYESLKKLRDDVIVVALNGDRQGYPQVDYTVNASLGIPYMTGPPNSPEPVAHILPAWDIIAGNMCVSALLAAERHRLRGFGGQSVDLSLKDVASATIGHLGMIADVTLNDMDRKKYGNALYGAYGQDFVCADNRRIMVIALTLRQWKKLISATGISEAVTALETELGVSFNDEGMRWQFRERITKLLLPWFSERRVSDFRDLFNRKGLTWSEFRTVKEALANDSDLSTDNPLFRNVAYPDIGEFLTPAHPVEFGNVTRNAPVPSPVLGAHTEEILASVVRLSDRDIGRLLETGVVASPNYDVTNE